MKKVIFLLVFLYSTCFVFHKTVPYHGQPEIPPPTGTNSLDAYKPSDNTNLESLVHLPATTCRLAYFNQNDPRWADKNYGPQNSIKIYGCGPTVLAMLVSSLTEKYVSPDEMAVWAYENGFFSQNSGSYHSIIPKGAAQWGLKAEPLQDISYESLLHHLYDGELIVMLMGTGQFTSSGHFIIVRGVSLSGKLEIADPNSSENTMTEWDYETLCSEIKENTGSDGSVWSISK